MKHHFLRTPLCACLRIFAFLSLMVSHPSTFADAHGSIGLNGGQLTDSGSNHIEFIGGSGYDLLIFAISDKFQKPVMVGGSAAFALVERDGQKVRIPLVNGGENILAATSGPSPIKGETVWFLARLANGETLNAKFISK